MRAHAIVIGIDGYPRPDWCLTGAVRDAIEFARWAVTAGGVGTDALTLLLSPLPGDPPLAELLKPDRGAPDLSPQAKGADWDSVRKTLFAYEKGRAKDAHRLWFYYAGHGLAPPTQDTSAGPLVVPSDVDDLDFYVSSNPIGLETFRGFMQDVPPKEQFFFVDACRDVLPPTGNKVLSQQLVWHFRTIEDDLLATQAVFLATTAGQRAKEIRGHGLFSRALLAALRGLGPELRPPTAPPPRGERARSRLLFHDVVEFVRAAVADGLRRLPGVQASDLKQVPYSQVNRLTGELFIADFAPEALPTAKVSAIIDPRDARPSARIEFLRWDEDQNDFVPRTANPAPMGPPVPEEARFEVRGGSHHLRITADGFERLDFPILVYEDKRFPIELQPQSAATPSPSDVSFGGLESVAVDRATIVVRCLDQLARVAVFDGGGNERGRAYGEVRVEGLAPGPYRVSAELTSTDRVEETVQAQAGQTHDVLLRLAAPPLSRALAQGLAAADIVVDETYAHPSESFGPVALGGLGSILAYAAWAARWPESWGFYHLRAIAVDPLPGIDPQGSAVQVLIGDALDSEPSFARGCRVELRSSEAAVQHWNVIHLGGGHADALPLATLPGLPAAVQGATVLPPGPLRVRVEIPGFAPASFAVALLPGFVTVLVLTREQDGDVDVQQHLNPIDPMVPVAAGFGPPMPDDVRLVELAWRALKSRDPLDAVEHRGLIEGKRSNPMLGVIAGYRMAKTDRADQFRGPAGALPPDAVAGPSPLWNMVRFFPGLPDVHVLAGIYDPDRRDEHFQRAMDAGTPVLVEGFWTLVEWLTETSRRAGVPPPVLRENVMPATVWTSFADAAPAPRVEGVRVVDAAGRSRAGARYGDLAGPASRSVGRLDADSDRPEDFLCSSFLIAPRVAVCPIHFALRFAEEQSDGSWTRKRAVRVRFDPADARSEREVALVLSALRPPSGTEVDAGTLDRKTLGQCWPVLMLLSEPSEAPPLRIAAAGPPAGHPVAVIGFPRSDARIPSETFARHFAGSAGEKHVMTGTVLRSPGESYTLDYDCFTADGTSGGPVVDLDSGDVVGMHVASHQSAQGRKRGVAVVLTRFAEALAQLLSALDDAEEPRRP